MSLKIGSVYPTEIYLKINSNSPLPLSELKQGNQIVWQKAPTSADRVTINGTTVGTIPTRYCNTTITVTLTVHYYEWGEPGTNHYGEASNTISPGATGYFNLIATETYSSVSTSIRVNYTDGRITSITVTANSSQSSWIDIQY